jgi:hypothetical protein
MSDSEKFAEQGRAHAALKEANGNAATVRASLLMYSKRLEEMSGFLKRFIGDPLAFTPEHVKADYRNLSSSNFESNVDLLVAEVKRANELQEQIKNF